MDRKYQAHKFQELIDNLELIKNAILGNKLSEMELDSVGYNLSCIKNKDFINMDAWDLERLASEIGLVKVFHIFTGSCNLYFLSIKDCIKWLDERSLEFNWNEEKKRFSTYIGGFSRTIGEFFITQSEYENRENQ